MKLFLALAVIVPLNYALATGLCEVEALREGGRAYVGLLRAGLESGDLTDAHLEQVLSLSQPGVPQLGTKLPRNHSYRLAFARALKHIQQEEWSSVIASITQLRAESLTKSSMVKVGQEATKAVFNIKRTGVTLDEGAFDPITFLSSKGEIFIFVPMKTKYAELFNFHTGEKTTLPWPTDQEPQFFESSNGQVFLLLSTQSSLVYSLYDLRAPQRPYFTFDIRKVKAVGNFVNNEGFRQGSRMTLFEANGFLKLAYYNLWWEQIPETLNLKTKPVVMIDVLAEAYTVLHLPNTRTDYSVLDDGRFYVAGSDRNEETRKSFLVLRDVLAERDLFRHDYTLDEEQGNIPGLESRVLTGPSGQPAIYLGHDRSDSHGMVDGTSRLMSRVDPFERLQARTFKDRNGRLLRIDMRPRGIFTPHDVDFHIGERGNYRNYYFPSGQRPEISTLLITQGTFGEELFFTSINNQGRIDELRVYNRIQEAWTRMVVPVQFNIEGSILDPFYDARTNRILGFAKTREDRWILLQYFGEQ